MKLTELHNISNRNLQERKDFIHFTQKDVAVLRRIAGWAKQVAGRIAREFYDHQFSFPPTLKFFQNFAKSRNMSLHQLRSHLESAQEGYFYSIFEEAKNRGKFDTRYFETRLRVGKLHNEIDLPLKWYLGSYVQYQNLVRKYLSRRFFFQPILHRRAERAIFAIFNYDMQAVSDSFLLSFVEALGIDVTQFATKHSHNEIGEEFPRIKEFMNELLAELRNTSSSMNQFSNKLNDTSGKLNEKVMKQAAALQQISATMDIIAKSSRDTSNNAEKARHLTAGTSADSHNPENGKKNNNTNCIVSSMGNIRTSSEEINKVSCVIDEIAFQTNLLALNASIEAAHAGAHGRGFAVVAEEVQALSRRCSQSALHIKELVEDGATKVNQGSALVENVAIMIAQITKDAISQRDSMNEASQALTQIESVAHYSAQQVEELNDMAKALSGRAFEIADIVQRFRDL